MPPITPLSASSYFDPRGSATYAPLRKRIVETASAMGFEPATMVEHAVTFTDDQDPFGHVMSAAYPHYFTACTFRVYESFSSLGDKHADFLRGRNVAGMARTYTVDLKRPVAYPDAIITAHRFTKVLPDRYHGVLAAWSLRQQAIVAEVRGVIVFCDFSKGKAANLIEAGGVYKDLYDDLTARLKKSNELAAEWERRHPKRAGERVAKL